MSGGGSSSADELSRTMEAVTVAAATGEGVAAVSPPKSNNVDSGNNKPTAKRDALRANEVDVQRQWETDRVYQSDAAMKRGENATEGAASVDAGGGDTADNNSNNEHFLVTFPYPYMNGVLHIGHAFSLTKAVFRAQYERHQGKNVLFPFAFHCTGMPIQAVTYSTNQIVS